MLTQIHLINYKIIKIMLKIIFTFMDCLTKRVKILDNMKKKTLYALENKSMGKSINSYLVMKFPGSLIQFFIVNETISSYHLMCVSLDDS